MNKVATLISPELVEALGWTILHSLWQGALVALALSALLILLNRHSAQVRYFVSVTALFTTLGLAVFTFFSLYNQPASGSAAAFPAVTFGAETHSVLTPAAPAAGWFNMLPFAGFFETYFEKHLPLIVTFWFLGLLVMALKMLGSLAYVQRLKNYQTRPLAPKWQQKLAGLQQQLAFTKPVKLLESVRVKVPVAIGYLKPVILMPIGAVNGLSEKQVEAILAHELAHIYRHDYLFNLVQTVVETIFFYHPALWWIGNNVRAERENCCDDIALNLCGDSVAFANALAELEEMTYVQNPALALAFNGRNGSLLGRIKRLVNQPRRRASFSEGFIAACFLMVSISAVSLNAMAQLTPDFEEFPYYIGSIAGNKATVKPEAPAPDITVNAIVSGAETQPPAAAPQTAIDLNSGDYALSVSVAPEPDGQDIIIVKDKKGRIVELYVDGKKVRKKDMPEFERIIEGRAGKKDKKKQEYASKADVREARKALQEMQPAAPQPRVYVYSEAAPQPHIQYRYSRPGHPAMPLPPAVEMAPLAPPVPPVPVAPMRPMKPLRPMRPLKPMAPHGEVSEADRKAYEKEIKEYELELKEYETNSGKEWKAFEKEMEEFGREMEAYSKEMEVFGKEMARTMQAGGSQVYVSSPDARAYYVDREKRDEAQENAEKARVKAYEKAAEARERAARDREKAAIERAKANEMRSRERERAAEERAKAAKERNERLDKLRAELRKDKLIGEKDKNLVYKISNEGLYVNGKKQPQATFEKYKKLFHPGLKEGANYNEVYNITAD